MYFNGKFIILIVSIVTILFFQACTSKPIHLPDEQLAVYINSDKYGLINKFMPRFLIEEYMADYNKIGTVSAKFYSLNEVIYINANKATIYTQIREFQTENSLYTNLIYRIHFKKIPKQYLTHGNNIGLFIIITLDKNNRPLLYTTMHTCGCFLAFIPSLNLNPSSYPKNWTKNLQYVYGESLPSFIAYKKDFVITFVLRGDTHRVKDVLNMHKDDIKRFYNVKLNNEPLSSLEKIYLNKNNTVSFFETQGDRKDYVKNSFKPWERLYISWWALDLKVGEDKRLGVDKSDGVVFYTSLKPWARNESDMRDFASFLKYWGWKL